MPLIGPIAALLFTMLKSKGRLFLGCCSFPELMEPLSVFGFFHVQILFQYTDITWENNMDFNKRFFFPSPLNKILLYIYASSKFFATLKTDRNFAYIMLKLSYTSFKACKVELIYCSMAELLLLPRPLTVLQTILMSH